MLALGWKVLLPASLAWVMVTGLVIKIGQTLVGAAMSRIYGSGILKSMRIAFRNILRKPITVQYPHEKIELPERARWAVAQKYDEDGEPQVHRRASRASARAPTTSSRSTSRPPRTAASTSTTGATRSARA